MWHRQFTDRELARRDAEVSAAVANACRGCIDEGDAWMPSHSCPVHGADATEWWLQLNQQLDRLYPGRWVPDAGGPADQPRGGGLVVWLLFGGVVAVYVGLVALMICWRAGLL